MKNLHLTAKNLSLLIVVIVCINIISSRLYSRFDITSEKLFSLSTGTISLLEKLNSEIRVKYYFTRHVAEVPVPVKTYASRVEELLREYVARSDGKLSLTTYDPKPDTDDEEWARKYGIKAVRLPTDKAMFFGLVFIKGIKEVVIPYLDPRREDFLEYDLSEALLRADREQKTPIGVLSSLKVFGDSTRAEWTFITHLQKNFVVKNYATDSKKIENDTTVLLLIHPQNLPPPTLYAIDQFVLRGGRLIVLVDPFSRTDFNNKNQDKRFSESSSSDLAKLFAAWQIVYDATKLVGDFGQSTPINVGGSTFSYPFFVSLGAGSFATDAIITSNMSNLLFAEGGHVQLAKDSPHKLEVLLKTTSDSGLASAQTLGFVGPESIMRDLKPAGRTHNLAAVVRGNFKSAFPAAPPSGGSSPAEKHLMSGAGVVLVVGDVDFLADRNAVEKIRFGGQVLTRVRNDNLHFIFNAVEFLAGSTELISIRSKGRIAKPFTTVQTLQRKAQLKWKRVEDELTARLTEVQKKLHELQKQRTDGNVLSLSAAQVAEIERFRAEEKSVRRERRLVRKNLREDIERLGNRLMLSNILIVPLLVGITGCAVFYRRSRQGTDV